jgi:hypothetical protein
MNEGTRFGTTMHSPKVVQDSDAYNPTTGRQDKAGDPAAVAALLDLCLHVVFCATHDGPPNWGCGLCAASLFVINAPSAVAAWGALAYLR